MVYVTPVYAAGELPVEGVDAQALVEGLINRGHRSAATVSDAAALAEVLAALLFLAIVIPTAVEALHVASLAGEVATRKGAAAAEMSDGSRVSPASARRPRSGWFWS